MTIPTPLERVLQKYSNDFIPILDGFAKEHYTLLDLSTKNPALGEIDITQVEGCQKYVDGIVERQNAKVAYGGYLEQRNLYSGNGHFAGAGDKRNIHLGMDFWAQADTRVRVPLSGKVHSFKNNSTSGDYGPTIILEHELEGMVFHTLYGHLSVASLNDLFVGKEFQAGSIMASLGTPDINVNYAPHLHFQIIDDMGSYYGDYPGVSTANDLKYYANNCPNPNFLLKVD
ncbi:peptidoglycan DD-metalloendopeptidase family protein [Sediminicola sp. 1XM1-17]|uniref:peptidoglycan DD-metalloendopeptidase family protein n=1 Tax=Sediminicola sp. 1XM1-17 TaxID=3127702 RepID=UPI0030780A7A